MRACDAGKTGSYWPSTETYELLREYIEMDFDGLQSELVQGIGGRSRSVDPDGFQNDMTTIECKDDVLTLLVYLGYLSYDLDSGMARAERRCACGADAHGGKKLPSQAHALVRESAQLPYDLVAMRGCGGRAQGRKESFGNGEIRMRKYLEMEKFE